jgi:leucyl/phenylalanyl-tRNA--protein transferase
MPIVQFPDPEQMGQETYLAIGGDWHPASLLLAYRNGIFPWPDPTLEAILWACPPERGILRFEQLRVSRSLRKAQKKSKLQFTVDADFRRVITLCAKLPRAGQRGTWITPSLLEAYCKLHELGIAHSFEAWQGTELVAGLYGVDIDGAFCGESMFHLAPNASKLTILFLVEHLKRRGLEWIDIQMLTPHMEALGAELIERRAFLRLLSQTRRLGLRLFST